MGHLFTLLSDRNNKIVLTELINIFINESSISRCCEYVQRIKIHMIMHWKDALALEIVIALKYVQIS